MRAQVVASLSASAREGCGSLIVGFTNQSTGPTTGYAWDFGNGNGSTQVNPATIYNTPGVYTVTLIAFGPGGNDTLVLPDYIRVYQRPMASWATTSMTGCIPLDLNFLNTSTAGTAPIASQYWDFGDGTNSTLQNPNHTYNLPGTYTAQLFVTDTLGCTSVAPGNGTITVLPALRADFGADTTLACGFPFTVSFTNASTGQGPLNFQWDFGDGNTSTTNSPIHTYNLSGNYDVGLVVDNGGTCADTLIRPAYIQATTLMAGFTAFSTQVCQNLPLQFQDTSAGSPVSWLWDFGDGSTSTAQNPSHTFSVAGLYSIQLSVTDAFGCSNSLSKSAWIEVKAGPTANFSASNITGCKAPLTANFTNTSTGGSSYAWNFGDGSAISSIVSPSHIFAANGTYSVKLVTTNAAGCKDSLSLPNLVQIIPPVANFTFTTVQSGCRPKTVQFTNTSTSVFDVITGYQWNYGDGMTSTVQALPHTYNTVGIWTVSLIVTTAGGCKDTLTLPNYVSTGNPPNASFTVSDPNPCYGDPVVFTSTSSGTNGTTTYAWDFGAGFIPGTAVQSYVFPDTGCYTVDFQASNNGCADTANTSQQVCVKGVVAAFSLSAQFACDTPATVTCMDLSRGANLRYDWDFGDGSAHSTAQNPVHTYGQLGTYTITLTATDTVSNCINTGTRLFRIGGPTADFGAAQTVGCTDFVVPFANTSSNASFFSWTFGDGGLSSNVSPLHTYTSPGNYSVQLIAEDSAGCRDTLIRPNFINVNGIEPNFGVNPGIVCLGTPAIWTDFSGSNGIINSWFWDFGDGANSTLPMPSHSYSAIGSFDVKLIVGDDNGCFDSLLRTNLIKVFKPNSDFTVDNVTLCPGEVLHLSNSSGGVNPLTFEWDFGDGNSSVLVSPSHIFAVNGSYPIALVAIDSVGCRDTMARNVLITSPEASFTVTDSFSSCPPLNVLFRNTSLGNIVSWNWDFGDGSGSTQENPTHVYTNNGSYDVRLVVATVTGCTDTILFPNRILVQSTMPSFQTDVNLSCNNAPVQFIATAPNANSLIWDFGDGNVQFGGDTVQYIYAAPGTYVPSLIVIDSNGCQQILPTQNPIVILPSPIANFDGSLQALCHSDSAFFQDMSSYGAGPGSIFWDFGDGTNGLGPNVSHSYGASGYYDVTLVVVDTLGCQDTLLIPSVVHAVGYAAIANVSPMQTCIGSSVSFVDSSLSDTTIVAWQWDFGDGSTGTAAALSHAYLDSGYFDVQLIITTVNGCRDTTFLPNAVQVQGPNGQLNSWIDTTCIGMPVVLSWVGDSNLSSTWYLGNGDSITGGDSIQYVYTSLGNFMPSVVLVDSLGCQTTLNGTIPITIMPGPVAQFDFDRSLFCGPDTLKFWDQSTASSPIQAFDWTFGDGSVGTGLLVNHYYAQAGSYDVSLQVRDSWGCTDADTISNAIRIHRQLAGFGANQTTACLPAVIQFTDSSTADTSIVAWDWLFGDGGIGTGATVFHTYIDTGYFDVTLVITTSVGCQDTVILPALIDLHAPSTPALWAVTVDGINSASAIFKQDSDPLFSSYQLFGESGPNSYYYISNAFVQTDTVLRDLAANSQNRSLCYRPLVANVCLDSSRLALTRLHCTINLAAIAGPDRINLSWNPYVGWDSVLRYDIFEVNNFDTNAVRWLATVGGNVTNYTDSLLPCSGMRSYRLRAVGETLQARSWSDTSMAQAAHAAPSIRPEMQVASVSNNADVQVDWVPSSLPGNVSYELFRADDQVTWLSQGLFPSNVTRYLDANTNVGAQSYDYRIAVADSCGAWSQPSEIARSILLQLDGSDGSARLTWNAYASWPNGILRYDVEAAPSNGGNWTILASLGAGELSYHDTEGLPNAPGTCYRIRAVEAGGRQSTSLSNAVCFSNTLWVPNTITPNGDGSNDALVITALAAFPGSGITIFNRWGNEVYSSEDYKSDWRGTNGKTSEPLPDGTYFWILDLSDGRVLKGYVTILR